MNDQRGQVVRRGGGTTGGISAALNPPNPLPGPDPPRPVPPPPAGRRRSSPQPVFKRSAPVFGPASTPDGPLFWLTHRKPVKRIVGSWAGPVTPEAAFRALRPPVRRPCYTEVALMERRLESGDRRCPQDQVGPPAALAEKPAGSSRAG